MHGLLVLCYLFFLPSHQRGGRGEGGGGGEEEEEDGAQARRLKIALVGKTPQRTTSISPFSLFTGTFLSVICCRNTTSPGLHAGTRTVHL